MVLPLTRTRAHSDILLGGKCEPCHKATGVRVPANSSFTGAGVVLMGRPRPVSYHKASRQPSQPPARVAAAHSNPMLFLLQLKCAQYWPQKEEKEMVFDDTNLKLTLISEDVKSYYTVRQLELENLAVSMACLKSSLSLWLASLPSPWVLVPAAVVPGTEPCVECGLILESRTCCCRSQCPGIVKDRGQAPPTVLSHPPLTPVNTVPREKTVSTLRVAGSAPGTGALKWYICKRNHSKFVLSSLSDLPGRGGLTHCPGFIPETLSQALGSLAVRKLSCLLLTGAWQDKP